MPDHLWVQGWFAMQLHCDSSPVDASPPAETSDLRIAGQYASSTVDTRPVRCASSLCSLCYFTNESRSCDSAAQRRAESRTRCQFAEAKREGGGEGRQRSTLNCAHGRGLWGACACALTFVCARARVGVQTEDQAGMQSGNQRQVGGQIGRQAYRQKDRKTGRQAEIKTDRQAGRQAKSVAGRQAGRENDRQAGRQAVDGRQAGRQKDERKH